MPERLRIDAKTPNLLGPDDKVMVGDLQIPHVTGISLRMVPGEVSRATIDVSTYDGLITDLPAEVYVRCLRALEDAYQRGHDDGRRGIMPAARQTHSLRSGMSFMAWLAKRIAEESARVDSDPDSSARYEAFAEVRQFIDGSDGA